MRLILKCKDCDYEGNEDHECVSKDGFYQTFRPVMDMTFSQEWLRQVAKEEDDVRFSVGGWTSEPYVLFEE